MTDYLERLRKVDQAPIPFSEQKEVNAFDLSALLSERDSLAALVAEADTELRYVLETRAVECEHGHPPPDEWCAKCRARAFLLKIAQQKGESDAHG